VKVNSLYDDMMLRAKVEDVGCLDCLERDMQTYEAGGGQINRGEKGYYTMVVIFFFFL